MPNELKRRRPRPGGKWHLDEVFIRIRGKLHYLWRAIDQHGHVLDILVQSRRNAQAAKRFLSAQGRIHNHFQLRRHRLTAEQHRAARDQAFRIWRDLVPTTAAM